MENKSPMVVPPYVGLVEGNGKSDLTFLLLKVQALNLMLEAIGN